MFEKGRWCDLDGGEVGVGRVLVSFLDTCAELERSRKKKILDGNLVLAS